MLYKSHRIFNATLSKWCTSLVHKPQHKEIEMSDMSYTGIVQLGQENALAFLKLLDRLDDNEWDSLDIMLDENLALVKFGGRSIILNKDGGLVDPGNITTFKFNNIPGDVFNKLEPAVYPLLIELTKNSKIEDYDVVATVAKHAQNNIIKLKSNSTAVIGQHRIKCLRSMAILSYFDGSVTVVEYDPANQVYGDAIDPAEANKYFEVVAIEIVDLNNMVNELPGEPPEEVSVQEEQNKSTKGK